MDWKCSVLHTVHSRELVNAMVCTDKKSWSSSRAECIGKHTNRGRQEPNLEKRVGLGLAQINTHTKLENASTQINTNVNTYTYLHKHIDVYTISMIGYSVTSTQVNDLPYWTIDLVEKIEYDWLSQGCLHKNVTYQNTSHLPILNRHKYRRKEYIVSFLDVSQNQIKYELSIVIESFNDPKIQKEMRKKSRCTNIEIEKYVECTAVLLAVSHKCDST